MDRAAREVLYNICGHFGVRPRNCNEISSAVPIGIEIEVKWRYYFPDLWLRFFDSGQLSYGDMTERMQHLLTQACKEKEVELIPKLRDTEKLGVRKGSDRYWEFALLPTYKIDITCCVVDALHAAGVLPLGFHPLHLTFGGLRCNRSTYYLLAILEILYTRKERLLAGAKNQAWATKGRAGIFEKKREDLLYGFPYGSEIKILEMPPDLDLFRELMANAAIFARHVKRHQEGKQTPEFDQLCKLIRESLLAVGLPDARWMNPKHSGETWALFASALPEIRAKCVAPIREFLKMG